MKIAALLTLMLSTFCFACHNNSDCDGQYSYVEDNVLIKPNVISIAQSFWDNVNTKTPIKLYPVKYEQDICHIKFVEKLNHPSKDEAVGLTKESSSLIEVEILDNQIQMGIVLAHEIGHAQGMGHVLGNNSLMNYKVGQYNHWTENDQAECIAVGLCF